MALVGVSNPAGTGVNLNYIGNRVYAHSGALTEVGSLTTALEFTTGSELIIGKMQFDGFMILQILNRVTLAFVEYL